uniref:Uncharacterized protein LOC111125927 isoform X2 n=1 Tax=Crassostrea virginica TaxID=6565 RepID=A0A8B8DG07_CRAVI|nr:uncharacterized protein LOC111125927 isoform X2 [Crassostrea virginica]
MISGNLPCPIGYFGNNCSVQCPHPSFGLFCGETCNCSQSDCDPSFGCWKYESSPSSSSTISSVETSNPVVSTSEKPVTVAIHTDKITHNTNNTNDNKFVVALSVTVASSALIVLAVVLTKLRSNAKANVIYYIHSPGRRTPLSRHNDGQVPFRNLETDIYMEIEDLDEIDETSTSSCGTTPVKGTQQFLQKTNVNNVTKSVYDPLKKKEKSKTDRNIDLFKQYIANKFPQRKVEIKRQYSWHHLTESTETESSLKRHRSHSSLSEDKCRIVTKDG